LPSFPKISENGVPVAIGNFPETQTEVFGRMESGPSLVKLRHKIQFWGIEP